ncbi:MAG TPA: ATP-binding protein, partial [Candidatus Obscuribacterales bacterium]
NTLQIAMGREPTASLDGMDELAQLDAIMHQMSSELASTRHRERSLIDNAAQIICSLSDVYAILDVNPAIEKMLGYKPESVQGTMVQALFHPQDREEAYEHLQRSKASEAEVNFVVRMRTQGGTYRYTEWTARWSAEDKNVFCIVQDISERKEAEKLRQEVIAMVSHDLRAPLTSLNISLGMVVEGVLGQLTERGVKILTRAQNSVIALIGMINDLLDLERIESGAFQLAYQPTESKKLLQEAVDMVAAQAEQRGIRIESSGDNLIASMDSDRVQRVLVNLIGNAIKFSPPGGKIFISSFKCTVGDNKGIEFRITDQGPGIPKDKLDLVFEKFQQVGTGSEGEKKGSGLGLAIAKAIVEAHNGAIGADSREGHGTTFWFRLPDEVRTRESVRSAN